MCLLCLSHVLTVRLDHSERRFRCPYCHRGHVHPPYALEHYLIGYGFCDLYGVHFPIEGGDGLGIVKEGERGRLYTVLWGAANPRPRRPARLIESQTE